MKKDCTLTMKQLQEGRELGFLSAEAPAASNYELQKRGCWHWKTGIVPQPGIVPLLHVLQFDEFKKE